MDDVRLSESPLSFVFLGDDAQFLLGDVEAGTVTPGITGRFAGGVLARGDWRICIKKFLSYTIRVPIWRMKKLKMIFYRKFNYIKMNEMKMILLSYLLVCAQTWFLQEWFRNRLAFHAHD